MEGAAALLSCDAPELVYEGSECDSDDILEEAYSTGSTQSADLLQGIGIQCRTNGLLDIADASTSPTAASEWGLDLAVSEASDGGGQAAGGEALRSAGVVLDLEQMLQRLLVEEGLLEDHAGEDVLAAESASPRRASAPQTLRAMRTAGALGELNRDAQATLLGGALYAYESCTAPNARELAESSTCGAVPTRVVRPVVPPLFRSANPGSARRSQVAEESTALQTSGGGRVASLAASSSFLTARSSAQSGSARSLSSRNTEELRQAEDELRLIAAAQSQRLHGEEDRRCTSLLARAALTSAVASVLGSVAPSGALSRRGSVAPSAPTAAAPSAAATVPDGAPHREPRSASRAAVEDELGSQYDDDGVFSIAEFDSTEPSVEPSPRSDTGGALPRRRPQEEAEEEESEDEDPLEQTSSSTWELGETPAPMATAAAANIVEFGLTGLLQHLALDDSSLDDSLARSVRRVMQLGTVLAGERLTTEEIQALPKVRFQAAEHQCCSICLEGYHKGELLTALRCNHFFHVDCLARWFQQSAQCPLCRSQCND